MMKARMWAFVSLAWGAASAALAQEPVQLKFSRVVDLTLPIESNMAGIPGLKDYAENLAITRPRRSCAEGMTLSNNLTVNGRAMISVLSILVHNGTHIDAPRHMIEKGPPIDQIPLAQVVKEAVLINLPHKGPNSSVSAKDILDTGAEFGPNAFPSSTRAGPKRCGASPSSGRRCPIWSQA